MTVLTASAPIQVPMMPFHGSGLDVRSGPLHYVPWTYDVESDGCAIVLPDGCRDVLVIATARPSEPRAAR